MYYLCFNCGKKVEHENVITRVRCLHCGGKMLYKDRRSVVTIKAV